MAYSKNPSSPRIGSWCALITLGCFATLTSYAYGTTAPDSHSTPMAITGEADMEPAEHPAPVKLWKRAAGSKASALVRKQAEAYATVYGITAGNMDSYRRWW